jgi:TolB-like protein
MENFSLAGHENPGLFGLGLIDDPARLSSLIITQVSKAVATRLREKNGGKGSASIREFAPQISFSREVSGESQQPLVAVLPFFNESTRKYASEIIHLHFVQQLLASGRYKPVEPGLIREKMLSMRIIMQGGVSLNQADLISNHLEADYVLAGQVFDYLDTVGPVGSPNVDFSAQMIARFSKEVVWASKSYNAGDEDVWFYDWHRVYTANPLAAGMVKSIIRRLGQNTVRRPEKTDRIQEEGTPFEQQFLHLP